MSEELAIVKGVDFGMRDVDAPCLWFSVEMLHGGSLQCFFGEDITRLLKEAWCYSIRDLEGRPCVVNCEGNLVKFVKWHKTAIAGPEKVKP